MERVWERGTRNHGVRRKTRERINESRRRGQVHNPRERFWMIEDKRKCEVCKLQGESLFVELRKRKFYPHVQQMVVACRNCDSGEWYWCYNGFVETKTRVDELVQREVERRERPRVSEEEAMPLNEEELERIELEWIKRVMLGE